MKYFADLSNLNLAYDVTLDGLIGYDLLQLGKLVIDFPEREIRIYNPDCCTSLETGNCR